MMKRSIVDVGPRLANLVLAVACGEARIGVEAQVHREVNRRGYVGTRPPEASLAAKKVGLPLGCRDKLNQLRVPFGKCVCTPRAPMCSACPVLDLRCQGGATNTR